MRAPLAPLLLQPRRILVRLLLPLLPLLFASPPPPALLLFARGVCALRGWPSGGFEVRGDEDVRCWRRVLGRVANGVVVDGRGGRAWLAVNMEGV
jgi:hypothetical protein